MSWTDWNIIIPSRASLKLCVPLPKFSHPSRRSFVAAPEPPSLPSNKIVFLDSSPIRYVSLISPSLPNLIFLLITLIGSSLRIDQDHQLYCPSNTLGLPHYKLTHGSLILLHRTCRIAMRRSIVTSSPSMDQTSHLLYSPIAQSIATS